MKRSSGNGRFVRMKRPKAYQDQVSDEDEEVLYRNVVESIVTKKLNDLASEKMTKSKNSEVNADRLIPDFDPENKDMNVTSWIKKIEQLGEIYKWSDEVKSFHLQSKLQGQARTWFNRLDSYEYSWSEWKTKLTKAFPRYHDYASLLDELMNRKKQAGESMTKYYQEKLAMCYRCQISGQAAVSCIIRGLPLELQANAQAFQSGSPDDLYEGFLSALDSYKPSEKPNSTLIPQSSRIINKGHYVSTQRMVAKNNGTQDPSQICYRCKEPGHTAPQCTMPDMRKCYRCGKTGHIANRCAEKTGGEMTKKIQILAETKNSFVKTVCVNNILTKAYIDTGSEVNVMSLTAAETLNLKLKPSFKRLSGFTGAQVQAKGEVNFDIKIDQIQMNTSALVADVEMGSIALIIGQTILNRSDINLNVSQLKAELSMNNTNPVNTICAIEATASYKVLLEEDITIPRGDSLVKVYIEDKPIGMMCSRSRQFSLGEVEYAIASSLIRDGSGYVRVCNLGSAEIHWKRDSTISRAERCDAVEVSEDGRL
ncbi:uncharacterized protein LOC123704765 [Colias croceus]|uniref:uncharacterized protein LOC123692567 n=1 Tax=Colias crocea TaxID=72248 RepID=UPI001E27DE83|nr:uncharacterized protein LOC123692567 [Colias croceus]XP_045509211.1 uncharacterized protein LOC123704765 [Colias croceus]